ncbi:putative signal peptide protein [Puccinia sorghi]|uniref:Putative signal peptide protein n=1 Tax=Puccinia sorghi TaxID=27349 RepID=A0A0L6VSD5_9BASI|nr:putative signal peptide protein [Puccinia sorghi]
MQLKLSSFWGLFFAFLVHASQNPKHVAQESHNPIPSDAFVVFHLCYNAKGTFHNCDSIVTCQRHSLREEEGIM